MKASKDKDRLELVRSIRFALAGFGDSLVGFMEWISDADAISKYNQEELERSTKAFLRQSNRYDLMGFEIVHEKDGKNLEAYNNMLHNAGINPETGLTYEHLMPKNLEEENVVAIAKLFE